MKPNNSTNNNTINNNEVQYKIIWDFIDEKGFVHQNQEETFANRDIANESWLNLKQNPNVTNIRTEKVYKEYFTVDVMYYTSTKIYTFLCHNIVTSDYVVVGTNGQLQVVKVISSRKTTKAELEKKMAFSRYSYIVGVLAKE